MSVLLKALQQSMAEMPKAWSSQGLQRWRGEFRFRDGIMNNTKGPRTMTEWTEFDVVDCEDIGCGPQIMA